MSLFQYDPPPGVPVRDGAGRAPVGGPVVCRSCGCRLEAPASRMEPSADGAQAWRHYEGMPGRDARGCRVPCVDLAHGADGRVLA
jgi:hypothetical protein